MSDTKQSAEDLAVLEQLNLDAIHSDQTNDVKRFRELLAEDFIMQTEGVSRNPAEYLEHIAKPRPSKDLAVHDVNIRILSDIALIHTDTYQKREGTWVCVAACALDPVPVA
jgi:hypothetical protein